MVPSIGLKHQGTHNSAFCLCFPGASVSVKPWFSGRSGDCKCPARLGAGSGSAGLGETGASQPHPGGIKDTGTQKRQYWATRGFCLRAAVFPVGLAWPSPSPILPKGHPPGQELSDSVVTSSPLGRMGMQKVLFLPLMSRPPCPVVAGPPGTSSISSPGRAGKGHRTPAPSMSDQGQFPGPSEATTGRSSFKNLPRGPPEKKPYVDTTPTPAPFPPLSSETIAKHCKDRFPVLRKQSVVLVGSTPSAFGCPVVFISDF